MYAIIDIETTGTSPGLEKITEIAVYIHDGVKIVEEYSTLINPEKLISPHITSLTGITNEMVADAPKFYEVAKKIIELTAGKTFVAHNSNFDYSFIKAEYKALGYTFQRKQLCTVRLSRKLIPGLRSYSLGKLCSELGIEIENRHRAAGDALATVKLFELLLNLNDNTGSNLFNPDGFDAKNLHPSLTKETINRLPEEAGLYYFLNEREQVIYIGKSKNIRSRVLSHLNNVATKRALEMKKEIVDIDFYLTGSELIALLMESAEIKKHKPRYNRAQRRSLFQYGLYSSIDKKGYINFKIEKNTQERTEALTSFNNKAEALKFLNRRIEKYTLCQKLCGMYTSSGNCFHYEIMECKGACIAEETADEYNQRANELIRELTLAFTNLILIDKGRNSNEFSFVKIENGKYQGFGFCDSSLGFAYPDQLDDFLLRNDDTKDVRQILKLYLHKNQTVKKISF